MYPKTKVMIYFLVILAYTGLIEAFFLKWGSDSARQATGQKTWVQTLPPPNVSPAIRYQYMYSPYELRKMYQLQSPQYPQAEVPVQHSMSPIPINIPAGASLTPVSLQHVQLVPCMCPVAPEEAEKLQEKNGPGPYIAQTFSQQSYTPVQSVALESDGPNNSKGQ